MMTKELMVKLNIEPSDNQTSEMFLLDIPNYKFIGKNFWIAQYNFRTGEDLRAKDLWCIFGYKRVDLKKISHISIISSVLLKDTEVFKLELEALLSKRA